MGDAAPSPAAAIRKGQRAAMATSALFLGSLGTLAELSELDRRAHNLAFAEAGLTWSWDRDTHARLIAGSGGWTPIESFARAVGSPVDARALAAAAAARTATLVAGARLVPRPGVAALVAAARARGLRVALCSTAAPEVVRAVLASLDAALPAGGFDWIGDASRTGRPKPAPDICAAAMGRLDLDPARVLAVEDTPECARAAVDVGCRVVGFPGATAAGRDFPPGVVVVERLQPRLLDLWYALPARVAAA